MLYVIDFQLINIREREAFGLVGKKKVSHQGVKSLSCLFKPLVPSCLGG